MPEPKRSEIASRMMDRGYDPNVVCELTEEGLAKLDRRLNELELHEDEVSTLSLYNWVSMLVSKRGQRKTKQLPLQFNDLPKDPARVKKREIKEFKRDCENLAGELGSIKNQIEIIMGYEDSGDQLAKLADDKTRIEKKLKQKQEEIDRLLT